jgi:hypothetical protein
MHRAPDRINKHAPESRPGRMRAVVIFARRRIYDLTILLGYVPGWRNGIRRGLKILWSESSVRVRPPPPALKINGFPPTTSSKQDYSIQLTVAGSGMRTLHGQTCLNCGQSMMAHEKARAGIAPRCETTGDARKSASDNPVAGLQFGRMPRSGVKPARSAKCSKEGASRRKCHLSFDFSEPGISAQFTPPPRIIVIERDHQP